MQVILYSLYFLNFQEVVTTAESKGIVKLIAPTERRGDATNAASQVFFWTLFLC